jgi:DHA1 family multidrug resistance protein-like MFS transporter
MPATSPRSTLNSLTIIVAIQWIGATLGLPLLPLFLEHRGGTPSVIGFIMAAFFVAGIVTQFFLGHLADKFGRRPVLIAGLVAYGIASATYLLPISAPWFALTRAVQGSAAGAVEVATFSAVAALFPEKERGRAVSRILAAQLLGIAVGPLLGSLASVKDLGWAFLATGVASLLASSQAVRANLGDKAFDPTPLPKLQWNSQIIGAVFAAISSGLAIGVYEACWTLLMHARHASTLQIRLSWTFFAIPWVALSPLGGWLGDHGNRRYIALAGMLSSAFFLSLYPHFASPNTLLIVGPIESIGAALSVPSIQSLLTEGAENRELSRRQGISSTANTAALAGSAAVSGVLFSRAHSLPFTAIALLSASCALSTFWWWRHTKGNLNSPRRERTNA